MARDEYGLFDFSEGRHPGRVLGPWREIPSTPEQQKARDFLSQLLGDVDLPGMSGAEQQGMDLLRSLLSGEYEYKMEDPRSSPFWKGFREESKANEAEGVSALRRRQQMGGMYKSSTGAAGEGKFRATAGAQRQQVLGGLYERAKQEPYQKLAAAFGYGGLPRELETQNMLFPYTHQSAIAQSILGEPRFIHSRGASPPTSGFAQAMGTGANMGLAAAGGSDLMSMILGLF